MKFLWASSLVLSAAAAVSGFSLFPPKCAPVATAHAPYVPPQNDPFKFPPNVTLVAPFATCAWVPSFPYTPETQCPSGSTNVVTPFVPLFTHPDLIATAGIAQSIIKGEADHSSAYINSMQNLLELHMSLNYFGCYNDADAATIQHVLSNYHWNSFNVSFNGVACDVDSQQAYILAEADTTAQTTLLGMVRAIENAVSASGVVVKQPREERFHMTLANVGYGYPSDCMVKRLHDSYLPFLAGKKFGSLRVCCFMTRSANGTIVSHFAQDCLNTGLCIF